MDSAYVTFKRHDDDAILPYKAHQTDACWDIFHHSDVVVPSAHGGIPGQFIIDTGLTVADMATRMWMRIEARSGLGFKHNVFPHPGVIDGGYRGPLKIKLLNYSPYDVPISKGNAIAQFSLMPLIDACIAFGYDVTESDRGQGGFGSTDGGRS